MTEIEEPGRSVRVGPRIGQRRANVLNNSPEKEGMTMKKLLMMAIAFGALAGFNARAVCANGVSDKAKAQKLQSDMVPAQACADGDFTADCSGSVTVGAGLGGNVSRSKKNGNDCTLLSGQVKMQIGKDTQVQLKGVSCAGTLKESGNLCGSIASYSTIANQNIDKNGTSKPAQSCVVGGQDLAGVSSYATGGIGHIACGKGGTCKGVITNVANPCPHNDAISETRLIQVFDADVSGEQNVNGVILLKACCGPGQQLVGGLPADVLPACQGAMQDVLAVPGTITQTTSP